MQGLEPTHTQEFTLGTFIGSKNPFFVVNTETVIHTWIMLGILCITLLPIRWILAHTRVGKYITLSFVSFFEDLIKQSLGKFNFNHFCFVTALFTFIVGCNTISLIPWLEEPTKDLNTTLALGIASFLYIQTATIKKHGIIDHIKSFFSPFFIMLPLNIIGELASIISMSFRLFGNIFGGSIITQIYFNSIQGSLIGETIGIFSGVNLLMAFFFTIFEGVLQAFVFAMLTLTYLSIGLQDETDE